MGLYSAVLEKTSTGVASWHALSALLLAWVAGAWLLH
jgi:hypothetical protein